MIGNTADAGLFCRNPSGMWGMTEFRAARKSARPVRYIWGRVKMYRPILVCIFRAGGGFGACSDPLGQTLQPQGWAGRPSLEA